MAMNKTTAIEYIPVNRKKVDCLYLLEEAVAKCNNSKSNIVFISGDTADIFQSTLTEIQTCEHYNFDIISMNIGRSARKKNVETFVFDKDLYESLSKQIKSPKNPITIIIVPSYIKTIMEHNKMFNTNVLNLVEVKGVNAA